MATGRGVLSNVLSKAQPGALLPALAAATAVLLVVWMMGGGIVVEYMQAADNNTPPRPQSRPLQLISACPPMHSRMPCSVSHLCRSQNPPFHRSQTHPLSHALTWQLQGNVCMAGWTTSLHRHVPLPSAGASCPPLQPFPPVASSPGSMQRKWCLSGSAPKRRRWARHTIHASWMAY